MLKLGFNFLVVVLCWCSWWCSYLAGQTPRKVGACRAVLQLRSGAPHLTDRHGRICNACVQTRKLFSAWLGGFLALVIAATIAAWIHWSF